MKNHYILKHLCIFLLLCGAWCTASAQTSVNADKQIYRWHNINPAIKLPAATLEEYKSLPPADYTTVTYLNGWSAAKGIESFAGSLQKQLEAVYILTVDENGYVKSVKIIKSNDKTSAGAFAGIIKNTKVSGPSYIQNQAVVSYIPCSITISKTQITIL